MRRIAKYHCAYLVDVFGGREQNRRFVQVAHRIEFRPFARRMIQFVYLLATGRRHFPFGRPPLFVSGLPLGSLVKKQNKNSVVTKKEQKKKKKIVRIIYYRHNMYNTQYINVLYVMCVRRSSNYMRYGNAEIRGVIIVCREPGNFTSTYYS